MQQTWHSTSFMFGLLCGALLTAALVGAAGYAVLSQGLAVEVQTNSLVKTVRGEVESQAQRELSRIVREFKKTMPEQVAARLTGSLESATIKLYETEIKLPESAVAELHTTLRKMVVEEIDRSLEALDREELVRSWGEQTEHAAQTLLDSELEGKTLLIELHRWVTVPVTVSTDH